MTAFFERIAERPAICDRARGADIIDSLTKTLGASPELSPAAKLLHDEPKVRDLVTGALACAPYLAAIAQRDPGLSGIAAQPLLASLESDPRWLTLLRSVGKAPEQLAAIPFDVIVPR